MRSRIYFPLRISQIFFNLWMLNQVFHFPRTFSFSNPNKLQPDTMLRQLFFTIASVSCLGLEIGADAASTLDPQPINSTLTAVTPTMTVTVTTPSVTITKILSTLTTSTSTFSISTLATSSLATITSTSTSPTSTLIAERVCTWCTAIPSAEKNTSCKLVVQVPENFHKILNYPILVFNHNLTRLVFAETITLSNPFYRWDATILGLDIMFIPALKSDNTDQA